SPSPQPVPAVPRPSPPTTTSPTSHPLRNRQRPKWQPPRPEAPSAHLRAGNETPCPTVPAREIRSERRLPMSTEVTDATFEETVLKSDKPVLVDFSAPWCGPCRMVSPIVDQIGEEHPARPKVVKVHTDETLETARSYGITAIAALYVVKDGEAAKTIIGARPTPALEEELSEFI